MLRNNLTLTISTSGATTKTTKTATKIPPAMVNMAASFLRDLVVRDIAVVEEVQPL
jgi:hypothetical protein